MTTIASDKMHVSVREVPAGEQEGEKKMNKKEKNRWQGKELRGLDAD